ncbi:hypothetical protein VPHK567_0109 [Vibrio phage K567]
MKLIPVQIDYQDDIYKMAKYLLTNDGHPDSLETKIGRFMLGRATGHTSAMQATASRLRAEGYRVTEVYLNQHMMTDSIRNSHHPHPDMCMTYGHLIDRGFSASALRGRCSHDISDIILFDTYSFAEQRIPNLSAKVEEFMYILHRHYHKRTAFFFIQ